jgi:hypothetical protein
LITSAPVNHGSQTTSTDFCNKIGPLRQLLQRKRMSAFTVTAEVTGARSIRRFLTHDVTSPPSNTALRKDYSITSSERATNLGIQPIVNR